MRLALRAMLALLFVANARITRSDEPSAEPQFQRHVVAVFSRLGCNGGTCHGAVQGKNGFRLSLFGAEAGAGLCAARARAGGPADGPARPEKSLLLLKATAAVPHGGGHL